MNIEDVHGNINDRRRSLTWDRWNSLNMLDWATEPKTWDCRMWSTCIPLDKHGESAIYLHWRHFCSRNVVVFPFTLNISNWPLSCEQLRSESVLERDCLTTCPNCSSAWNCIFCPHEQMSPKIHWFLSNCRLLQMLVKVADWFAHAIAGRFYGEMSSFVVMDLFKIWLEYLRGGSSLVIMEP